jgi:hypothetical protein
LGHAEVPLKGNTEPAASFMQALRELPSSRNGLVPRGGAGIFET